MIKKIAFFFVSLIVYLLLASPAYAQSCQGGINYTESFASCDRVGLTYVCNQTSPSSYEPCTWSGGSCVASYQAAEQNCVITNGGASCRVETFLDDRNTSSGCSVSSTSTPPPNSTPPPGSTCGGGSNPQCVANNCGNVGKVSGSGSCPNAGDVCCVDIGSSGGSGGHNECEIIDVSPKSFTAGVPTTITLTWRLDDSTWHGSEMFIRDNVASISFNPASKSVCCGSTVGERETTSIVTFNQAITDDVRFTIEESENDGGDTNTCEDTFTLSATYPAPWWQAVNASVIAGGTVRSKIPTSCVLPGCSPYLIRETVGGNSSAGVVMYGESPAVYDFSSAAGSQQGQPSDPATAGWLAQSENYLNVYNYGTARALVPSDAPINTYTGNLNGGTAHTDGYTYFQYNGTLDITNTQAVTNKVVLFVTGALRFSAPVTIGNPGTGFFMAVAGNDIVIDPLVGGAGTHVNGILITDGEFRTSTGNTRFRLLGSIVAWGGYDLRRDLQAGNSTAPAEEFAFDPRLIVLFPPTISKSSVVWKEIAP